MGMIISGAPDDGRSHIARNASYQFAESVQ